MTGKFKRVWNYAKFVFWGVRTNPPKHQEQNIPKAFPNSSIADIIQNNIESRMRESKDSPVSNNELLRRLRERQK